MTQTGELKEALLKVVPWTHAHPLSEQEAEALLRKEGYESFRWYDVPGASYPRHRHNKDECLWVIKGQLTLSANGTEYQLNPGDRLYLPSGTPHTASVPLAAGVTYLVGQKNVKS